MLHIYKNTNILNLYKWHNITQKCHTIHKVIKMALISEKSQILRNSVDS